MTSGFAGGPAALEKLDLDRSNCDPAACEAMETIDQAGLVVVSSLSCPSGMAAPSPSQPGQEAQVQSTRSSSIRHEELAL